MMSAIFYDRPFVIVAATASLAVILTMSPSRADDNDQDSPKNEGWLTSVLWEDDHTLLATQSEGLLLRPGKLTRIRLNSQPESDSSQTSQSWQVIGESETSLWSTTSIHGEAIASDYKGQVLRFKQQPAIPMQVEARWIRKIAPVPNQPQSLLAGTEDGKLLVLSTESNSEVKRVELGNAAIFDIAFRPDHKQIAVACGDGSIHVRTWPELEAVYSVPAHGHAVWSILYVDNGQQFLSGGADRKVRLWNATYGRPVVAVASTPDWITSLITLPNSSLIAAGCLNGDIVLLDYKTMLGVQTVKMAASGIWSMALSPNGKQLAVATRRNALVLVSDLNAWYEAGRTAASTATSEVPPEPSSVQ